MSSKTESPDVRQLRKEELAQSPFPGGQEQAFRVFFEPAAHTQIWQHAQADMGVEICGVLVGKWGRDDAGAFVNISASIRGEAATSKFAEVTFTHETWSVVNAEMDSKYTDRSIVGWYHTHPDFGIFLSDRDRFIQENFFSGPGQIAHVVDPIRKTEGVFTWNNGKPTLAPFFWVGNRLSVSPQDKEVSHRGSESTERAETAKVAASADSSLNDWAWWAQKVLSYVLVFMLGWLLAGRLSEFLLNRARHEGTVSAFYQYGLKPDLEVRLADIQNELQSLARTGGALKDDHFQRLRRSEGSAEEVVAADAQWAQIQTRVNNIAQTLQVIEQDYCLDKPEQEAIRSLLKAKLEAARRDLEKQKTAETKKSNDKKEDTKRTDSKDSESKQPTAKKPESAPAPEQPTEPKK